MGLQASGASPNCSLTQTPQLLNCIFTQWFFHTPHLPSNSYHLLCLLECFVLESRMFFEGSVCTSLLSAGLHTCLVGASLKVSSIATSYYASHQVLLPAPQIPCPCRKLAE